MRFIQTTGTTITLTFTIQELETVNNALNEICNGIDVPGFETRIGATREDVQALLGSISVALKEVGHGPTTRNDL
jgi:hypothetical protein